MTKLRWIISACLLLWTLPLVAADYAEGGIRKNDGHWMQFNLYHGFDNKIPFGNERDTFFEIEFGGRSGFFDIYGFLDVFDATNSPKSDLHNEDNMFLKFVPRFSLDAIFQKDLSVGLVREWYIANMIQVADRGLFSQYLGVGTDVDLPWFGRSKLNIMGRYVRENYGVANENRLDGAFLGFAWFKPLHAFTNKSFITYQGYFDYTFGAKMLADSPEYSDSSLEWFNGLYWHTDRYAVGYGLKYYKDMGLLQSGGIAGTTTGFGHYFIVNYKF